MKNILLIIFFALTTLQGFGQFTQEWVSHYNGVSTNVRRDDAEKVACDSHNNVYVFGHSDDNFMLVSYDPAGNIKWSKELNGTANDIEEAKDIYIDNYGYIYITGAILNYVTTSDILVAKYDSLGNSLWRREFDISSNGQESNSMVVDQAGNVFIAGFSNSLNLTVKLDSLGNTVWYKTYSGSGFSGGQMMDVELDIHGNVIVTGFISNSTTSFDWITIKYDPLGNVIWTKTQNGSSNGNDSGVSLVTDSASNVYVCGYKTNGTADGDAFIISYDSLGNTRWTNTYNGTDNYHDSYGKIKLFNNKLYVTGKANSLSTGEDVLTRAYSSTGSILWTQLFSGVMVDVGLDLVLDSTGNVFVGAYSMEMISSTTYGNTIKYDNAGNLIWERPETQHIRSIFLDSNEDVLVTGYIDLLGGTTDIATIKYDQSGTTIWSRNFHGGFRNEEDEVADMRVDSDGNTIVGGKTDVAPVGNSWVICKINSAGVTEWVRTFSGSNPSPTQDRLQVLELDNDNNIIAGGWASTGPHSDATVVKYDTNGNLLWTYIYDVGVPSGGSSWVNDLYIDSLDNIYFTGRASTGAGDEVYVVKLDASGILQWARTYNGAYPGGNDKGYNIIVDDLGNVYIAGEVRSNFVFSEVFVRKYDPNGTVLWTRTFAGTDDQIGIHSRNLMLDHNDNVVVGGIIRNIGTGYDYFVTKYDPAGNTLWAKNYFHEYIAASVMDKDGSVYTIGDSVLGSFQHYRIYKTDTLGNIVWTSVGLPGYIQLVVTSGGKYACLGVKDQELHVAIIAMDSLLETGQDYMIIQYDSIGNVANSARFDAGNGRMNETPIAIALNDHGNVYVSGFGEINSGTDIYTVKYCSAAPAQPTGFSLSDSIVCTNSPSNFEIPYTGASTYNWSYSGTGATITGSSNSVIVSFDPGATDGTLSVEGLSSCGIFSPVSIFIVVNDTLPASLFASADTVCSTSSMVLLTGSPSGGIYSGPGVSGGNFSPSAADLGSNSITYTITDSNACVSTASLNIYVNVCTGVDESDELSVTVFPNPANDDWTIAIAETVTPIDYFFEMFDISGRILRREQLTAQLNKFERGELNAGIYFYRLLKEKNTVNTGKIILE